jgi:hypothetical protein
VTQSLRVHLELLLHERLLFHVSLQELRHFELLFWLWLTEAEFKFFFDVQVGGWRKEGGQFPAMLPCRIMMPRSWSRPLTRRTIGQLVVGKVAPWLISLGLNEVCHVVLEELVQS